MKFVGTLVVALGLTAWGASDARAVLVFEKGQKEPARGYLIRETAAVVVIDEVLGDGTVKRREISKATIDEVLNLVATDRLQALRPAAPQDYRDYAEELAAKKRDPDAQSTAIRLYLIAAHLDPVGLGPSALRGMTALARNAAEEQRIRAMTYLLDPAHDPNVLKPVSATPATAVAIAESDEIVTAIRLLRRGNKPAALKMASHPGVKLAFRRVSEILSYSDFVVACGPGRDGGQVSAPLLRKLLLAELALTPAADSTAAREPPAPADASASKSVWSDALSDNRTQPVPTLTLRTLTEFDPTKSLYHDGVWIEAGSVPGERAPTK